jgi:Zn-dependent protease with chaperone function
MISGIYFDGRNSTAHRVQIKFREHAVVLLGQGIELLFAPNEIKLAEPYSHAPVLLELGNGAHCEIQERADKKSVLRALRYKPSMVERWQSKWHGALGAVVVMIGLLFCAFHWGIPRLTTVLVARIPASVELDIGAQMLPVLDQNLFQPSGLSDQRMKQVRVIFQKIAPAHPRIPMRLVFRIAPRLGANAVALPDGTIVVTDQMIVAIVGKSGDLTGERANQLAGVLAHEIGHIEHRHTLQALLSNSAVLAISASLFGDYSALVTAIPTIVIGNEYSREMESEADDYAIQTLKEHQISPICMAEVFESLQRLSAKNAFNSAPKWMRIMSDYSSNHPATALRIQRFRDAAAASPNLSAEIVPGDATVQPKQ